MFCKLLIVISKWNYFVIYRYAMYVCVTCIVFSLYLYNSSDCNKAWWNEHAYFYIHFLTRNVKLPSKSWFRIRFQNFKSITSHTLHPHNITKQHSYTYLIELPNQEYDSRFPKIVVWYFDSRAKTAHVLLRLNPFPENNRYLIEAKFSNMYVFGIFEDEMI